jgi:hypothetical protein
MRSELTPLHWKHCVFVVKVPKRFSNIIWLWSLIRGIASWVLHIVNQTVPFYWKEVVRGLGIMWFVLNWRTMLGGARWPPKGFYWLGLSFKPLWCSPLGGDLSLCAFFFAMNSFICANTHTHSLMNWSWALRAPALVRHTTNFE